MALSSTQLQSHHDEIMSQMLVLPLNLLPKAVASSLQLDAAAARVAKSAAAELHECQVCSSSSEPDQLQLLFTTRLQFHDRAVHVTAARFVCPLCAAASNCNLVLQLLTPDVGTPPNEQRAAQVQQLLLHFAAVNNAPASITSNQDTLAMVVQELACRAYSLGVVANSLGGWQQQPPAASTAQLLQQLLKAQRKAAAAAAAGPVEPQADAAAVAGGGAASSRKKKKQLKGKPDADEAAAAAAASAGGKTALDATARRKQRKKRRSDAAQAAAAAAGASPAVEQVHLTTQQPQPPSAKKHKAGSSKGTTTPAQGRTPKQQAGSKQAAGAHAASELRTPQHSKVKLSSGKKQKLLQSAPR